MSRSAAGSASRADGIDRRDLLLPLMQRGDLFLDAGRRVVLELRVVLMQTGGSTCCRRVLEVDLLKVLLGERVECLARAIGGGVLCEQRMKCRRKS